MSGAAGAELQGVRVLVVFGSIPVFGMERATIALMRDLRSRGASVRFVTEATYGRNAVEPLLAAEGFEFRRVSFFGRYERGMTLRRLATALRMLVTESFRFRAIVREFRPTVIHVGTFSFFLNLWPALALGRTPILYRAGDYPADHTAFHRFAWRYAVHPHLARMVAVSEFVARAHRRLGLHPGKLSVIPNALPVVAPRSAAHARVEPRLLFVGQVSPHKGTHHLVEAALALASKYPEMSVDIVGPVDTPYAQNLMRAVRDAGLEGRIRFHAYVAEPAPFFQQATVHVAPSQCNEAFGLVVVEAKAAGVPSVVFPDGALPDLVRHGRDGLVCAEPAAAALEAALGQYLDDPGLVRTHGAAALRSISELGIDRAADRYAAAVRRLSEPA